MENKIFRNFIFIHPLAFHKLLKVRIDTTFVKRLQHNLKKVTAKK